MIDVRNAVQLATNYLQDIDSIYPPTSHLQDLRVEEVEISEDKTYWFITLGFIVPNVGQPFPNQNPLGISTLTKPDRQYKIFKIDADTGDVLSMKIREL
ncbi:MAG: hypothetical protein WBB28_12840 [Crinalium sp.]